MIHKLLTFLMVAMISNTAWARSYDVYDYQTSDAYILQQPLQGVFLGQMMRNLGLTPDWTNRRWIELIHLANPQQIDATGEILFHNSQVKIPLAAMKGLYGYNKLENYFQPYDPPQQTPPPAVTAPQAGETTQPVEENVAKEQVVVIEEEEKVEKSGPTLWSFKTLAGAGGESFTIDDNQGNSTELFVEANAFIKLDLTAEVNQRHRFNFALTGQYKTYQAPLSVGYQEDSLMLMSLNYGYGVRLFNHVYLNFIGQNKQVNYVDFVGSMIQLQTAFAHSAGMGLEMPLFFMGGKQLSLKGSAQVIYADGADAQTDTGFFASTSLNLEPKGLESGWLVGAQMNYFDQTPTGFALHSSLEGLGYIGYAF